MDEIRKDLEAIRESQIRMEVDLKYHVKRTDVLEKMVLPLHKTRIFFQYLVIMAGSTLTVYGLLQLLKVV